MLGTKRRYVIGLSLAIVGWIGTQFVSLSGLEQVRLTPKLSWIPTTGDGQPQASGQPRASQGERGLGGWSDADDATWTLGPSSPSYVSHRISSSGSLTDDSVRKFFASPSSAGLGAGQVASSRRGSFDGASAANPRGNAAGVNVPRIRIASFNLGEFGEDKLRKLPVTETLVRIIRQFDVIALQGITSRQSDTLPLLTELINRNGREFEFLLGPPVGREQKQQFAFLFDTARIETDRGQLYTVEDPQDLITYAPLVAWFRTKLPQRSSSFTFSLVNVRIAPKRADEEIQLLPSLIRSVRSDGRLEDDTLLAGEFMASSQRLAAIPGLDMTLAIEGVPTTVAGDAMTCNILFPTRATDEFTGLSGVVDFLRQLNLSLDQALQVSSSLPIWAEFTAYEGSIDR
ncbi:hypothetical protein SH449x_004353 [Pirellulaceae bacterium SH449]